MLDSLSNRYRQSYKKKQEILRRERSPRKRFRLRCHIPKNSLFFVSAADYPVAHTKGARCFQSGMTFP
jgi:hypothetical protein